MSKEMTVIALGLLVAVTPYLGVPGSWKTALYILAGLALAGVGFLLRGEALRRSAGSPEHGHFVENTPAPTAALDSRPRDTHGIGPLN